MTGSSCVWPAQVCGIAGVLPLVPARHSHTRQSALWSCKYVPPLTRPTCRRVNRDPIRDSMTVMRSAASISATEFCLGHLGAFEDDTLATWNQTTPEHLHWPRPTGCG